jgi:serine/threonine-protein kinase HipA
VTRRAPVYRWCVDPLSLTRQAVRVGELTQHTTRWEFLYDPGYLSLGSAAWELDPTGIRNKQRSAHVHVGVAPPPVFCDVALSGWSLDVLKKHAHTFLSPDAAQSPEPWGWWERLIYAPADGFGALFVGELANKPPVEPALHEALHAVTRATLPSPSRDSSSGAMGGERPKIAALMPDANAQPDAPPKAVLLKFSLPAERPDSVIAEATALTLASQLGMDVPHHEIKWFNDAPALCIDRFDRAPGGALSPAHHCVSAATALNLLPGSDVDDPRRSYVLLRSKLKRPGDPAELFRRIVFNAIVGNTDDHPWNTSLRQEGLGDWALSPLYDVMPFFGRQGCPVFRMAITHDRGRAATRHNLVRAGWQIARMNEQSVLNLIRDMDAHVHAHWRAAFALHHTGAPDAANETAWRSVFECAWMP